MKNNFILFYSLLNEDYNTFVKKLFDYQSLINNSNEKGETLLHYCCYYGLIEKFYAIINLGGVITKTNEGNTLLHYACQSGRDDFMVLELIKMGVSPTLINNKGETSLHSVANEKIAHYLNMWAKRNNIDVVSLLDEELNNVAHGCKINGNINGSLYWIAEYPILKEKDNLFGKKWNQCKRKKINRCIY